jgi:uncharacterized protein YecT (DUF1311 family)
MLPLRQQFVAITLIAVAFCPEPGRAQTQTEMSIQAAADFQKADARMNQLLASLKNKYAADTFAGFQKAQEAWRRFMEEECAFENYLTVGGSIHPMEVNQCRTRFTLQRVKDLELLSNCREGDLSCPWR